MAFHFRRAVRVLPSICISLSKSGASVFEGPKETRTTVRVSGTVISYTTSSSHHCHATEQVEAQTSDAPQPRRSSWGAVLLLVFLLWAFWSVLSRA